MQENDFVDVCIIGAGAAGGLMSRLLAEVGIHVMVLEAGPWHANPEKDFTENEVAMQKIWWPEKEYLLSGNASRGRINTGLGVGGGTLLWTGAAFRLFPEDFIVSTQDGMLAEANLADWPITYQELEPYYDAVEEHIGVAGAVSPWDAPGRKPYPLPPHDYHRHTVVLRSGFQKLGLRTSPGPVAIASRPLPGRESCCYCGFCMQGCRTGAMYSTATAEIPAALATGLVEIRPNSLATRINTCSDGTSVDSVEYLDVTEGKYHRQKCKVVILASNTIEIPRLLLNSANKQHPYGLANSSDQLGRNFMSHPGAQSWGVFEQDMNPFEGFVLNHLSCLDFAPSCTGQPFIRGFAMESLTALPIGLVNTVGVGLWGTPFIEFIKNYRKLAGLFTICEGLPVETNRVGVHQQAVDQWGLPKATIHYDWHPNDIRLMDYAAAKSKEVLYAAGAREVLRQPPNQVHMMGTARMGKDPSSSVTDAFGETHDIKNLYVGGGALFPTGSCVNPTLTILALAWKSAERIAGSFGKHLRHST